MADSLAALQALLSGGLQDANDPVKLALLRQQDAQEANDQYLANLRAGARTKTIPGGWQRTGNPDPGFPSLDEYKYVPESVVPDVQAENARQGEMNFQKARGAAATADAAADPFTGEDAQALTKYFDPQVARQREAEDARKLRALIAPEQVKSEGALALQREKNAGDIAVVNAQQAPGRELMQRGGMQGGGPGANMSFKPSINAKGEVSYTSTPTMPALVQRAFDQLSAAKQQTQNALLQAERMYPGISSASENVDQQTSSQGWLDTLLGRGAPYGGAKDLAGAANERLKYTLGIPTPFANLAQEASFGNIEQMAGQLPGVRGLATITPLFKEHQSRWGYETPLQTVQRLRHMLSIMDETLTGMRSGDFSNDQTNAAPGGF